MTDARTTIDWCRFRTQAEPVEIARALSPFFVSAFHGEAQPVTLRALAKGMHGFQQAAAIVLFGEIELGRMDYGGASQRGWVRVEITGKGCEWVNDWEGLQGAIEGLGGQLRRLDVALTTYAGEVTHEAIVAAHAAGLFNSVLGGSRRHLQQITSSDANAGRTCYIGTRAESDVFLRCYEKGKELAGRHAGSGSVTHIGGVPVEDIYRVEVEFKAVNRPLPLEAITKRDEYFVIAYPYCQTLLSIVSDVSLPARRKVEQCNDLAAVASHIRRQFGPSILSLAKAHGGDIGAVFAMIVGHVENPRLASSVLAHADVRRAVSIEAGTGAAAPSV